MEDSSELITNPNFVSLLQCPQCAEYFTIPIYQCDSGHSICIKCSNKSQRCSSCAA